mgnify:CR=1 FL=1
MTTLLAVATESLATDRREFLLGAMASAAVAAFLGSATGALAQAKPPTWEEALKKIAGDVKPVDGKIMLDLPEIAENGNTVPFTVAVDSPMTDKDFVKAVHVFATGNPQPAVASFRLTPDSGKAQVSSRMRLARTQDIVSVAELSDGKFIMTKRTIKVTIGGCGG